MEKFHSNDMKSYSKVLRGCDKKNNKLDKKNLLHMLHCINTKSCHTQVNQIIQIINNHCSHVFIRLIEIGKSQKLLTTQTFHGIKIENKTFYLAIANFIRIIPIINVATWIKMFCCVWNCWIIAICQVCRISR